MSNEIEFNKVEVGDNPIGVGFISSLWERDFIRHFGHLLESKDKRIEEIENALKEIILTQPVIYDGGHQGDYACDLHIEIAEQALKGE